jgi:hypothetical protein
LSSAEPPEIDLRQTERVTRCRVTRLGVRNRIDPAQLTWSISKLEDLSFGTDDIAALARAARLNIPIQNPVASAGSGSGKTARRASGGRRSGDWDTWAPKSGSDASKPIRY